MPRARDPSGRKASGKRDGAAPGREPPQRRGRVKRGPVTGDEPCQLKIQEIGRALAAWTAPRERAGGGGCRRMFATCLTHQIVSGADTVAERSLAGHGYRYVVYAACGIFGD